MRGTLGTSSHRTITAIVGRAGNAVQRARARLSHCGLAQAASPENHFLRA